MTDLQKKYDAIIVGSGSGGASVENPQINGAPGAALKAAGIINAS